MEHRNSSEANSRSVLRVATNMFNKLSDSPEEAVLQLRLGAHMQFSVVQLFDWSIICYAHTVQLNDRSTVMSAHMQLNSCCNDKLC
jgi:hypothetical protein